MERIKSGITGFDELLYGGLPKGRTVLIAGNCGTGKTTISAQFIQEGVRCGENGLYVTFEQSKKKLIEDVAELGIKFDLMINDSKLALIGGPIGDIKFFKEKTNADASDIIKEIEEVAKQTCARRIVVDSINLFTILFEGENEKRRAMAQLVSTLENLHCTSLITCEVPEASEALSWHGFEDFVVDGVVLLARRMFKHRYERSVAIAKMRGIDHSKMRRGMDIGKSGVVIFPDKPPNYD